MLERSFIFDHDLHIHSVLSSCSSDPEQSPARILQYARAEGLSTVCLTDHYWDSAVPDTSKWYAPQNFEHISQSRPLPTDPRIRFLFGCETEMRADHTLGIPKERFADFDFVIIPTTHLHMTNHTITKEDSESLEARARLWAERFEALLSMELPFSKIGIAHLACPLLAPHGDREAYRTVLNMIPTETMEGLFKKAATLGIGIELNSADMNFSEEETDTVLRMFRIAKTAGCKFYLGSDAHHPTALTSARPIFERAVNLLGLKETDKFHI